MTDSSLCASDASAASGLRLDQLGARGVALWRDGDALCLRAPRGILAEADVAEIKRNKPEIMQVLQRRPGQALVPPGLRPTPEQEMLLRAGSSESYLISGMFACVPPIATATLLVALDQVLSRHDAFRLRICQGAQETAGLCFDAPLPPVHVLDMTELSQAAADAVVRQLTDAEAVRHLDIRQGSPLRVRAVVVRGHTVAVCFSAHHVVMDRWSMDVLGSELFQAVAAAERGTPWQPPPAPSFAVAVFERRLALDAGRFMQVTRAARDAMAVPAERPELPGQRLSALHQTPAQRSSQQFPQQLRHDLARGGRGSAILLAALATLLRRHADGKSLRFGLPVACRGDLRAQLTVGLFATTVPLVLRISEAQDARALIAAAAEALDAAMAIQDADMSETLRDFVTNGLSAFDVIVAFQSASDSSSARLRAVPSARSLAKCDLMVFLDEHGATFEYAERADRQGFDRLVADFVALATRLARAEAGVALAAIDPPAPCLTPPPPAREWGEDIGALLDAAARRRPDAIALADFSCDPPQLLSYRGLLERAAHIASALAAQGAGPERCIGIAAAGATARVVAALGILHSGGAYAPIDLRWPAERQRLVSARLSCVLTDTDRGLVHADVPVTNLAEAGSTPIARVPATPSALAYMLSTSGSTGVPKGVGIERRNTAALIAWAAEAFEPASLRRVLAMTPLSFDLSVFEMLAPLAAGGTIVCLESPLEASRRLAASEPTLVNTTPSVARELCRTGVRFPADATVILCGEPFGSDLVRAIYGAGASRLLNLYGPTETTTYSSVADIEANLGGNAPIGQPIAGTSMQLGENGNAAAPPRWRGEIVIGGAGVARGYLSMPAETAARFRPDPNRGPGARAFWTGDRGAVTSNGLLSFLGRHDRQVKRRGIRIELDEVEAALLAHAQVAAAAAVFGGDAGGGRIVAFIVPSAGEAPDIRALKAMLPSYMAPDQIHLVGALPETTSGKIDRGALELSQIDAGPTQPPQTPREAAVAAIWAAVIGREIRDRHARFFEAGGDSLKLMTLTERLRRRFGVAVSPDDLLRNPTVVETAQLLARAEVGPGALAGVS